jgi:hypothetical protein
MKPFKTIGSFCLAASALFLVTSCTKTVDEQLDKGDRDVEQLNGNQQCGNFIGLRMQRSGSRAYFWYGNENNRQTFLGNNWIPKNFVEVTSFSNGTNPSIVGTPTPEFSLISECIGVKSNVDGPSNMQRINVGEVLSFKLGTDFLTIDPATSFAWYGFDLNLNASLNCVGTIQLRKSGVVVGTVPFTGAGKNNKNFSLTHTVLDDKYFDEIRFFTTAGAFHVNGFGKNDGKGGPWLPTVKFFLIDLPNNVFLNTNTLSNPFISAVINGVDQQGASPTFLGRQLRTQLIPIPPPNPAQAGNGDFNNAGSPLNTNIWMDLNASGITGHSMVYAASSIGIRTPTSTGHINAGEILTIKAGPALSAFWSTFSVLELRTAYGPGTPKPFSVTLYKNNVLVGGPFLSYSGDRGISVFSAPGNVSFDEARVTGTSGPGTEGAIGRPGHIIKLYRGCN